jgi:uncharacterized protein (TIGR02271 family)
MPDAPFENTNTTVETVAAGTETVIPLFEETLAVSKRKVAKGRVQVSRLTRRHEELVNELLTRESVEVERTPIGKPIDALPSIRDEGDTIVVPIVEEVLKVERQLVLKEEVRIRRVKATERYQERFSLRRQEVTVNRLPGDGAAVANTHTGEASDPKENL